MNREGNGGGNRKACQTEGGKEDSVTRLGAGEPQEAKDDKGRDRRKRMKGKRREGKERDTEKQERAT